MDLSPVLSKSDVGHELGRLQRKWRLRPMASQVSQALTALLLDAQLVQCFLSSMPQGFLDTSVAVLQFHWFCRRRQALLGRLDELYDGGASGFIRVQCGHRTRAVDIVEETIGDQSAMHKSVRQQMIS
jgi:hypothetical protein